MKHLLLNIIAPSLFLPVLALAAEENLIANDLSIAYTIPKVQVTHYSATPRGGRPCKYECGSNGCVGGRDESSSGVRPLSATIEKPGVIKGRRAVLTAVPQRGGSGGVFGCFFALPDAYPGVLFFAGDVYGEGSNGKLKTDVSSECTPRVNKTLYSRMEVFNCKGLKGIPAGQTVKRDPPAPPRQVSQSERSQEPAPQRNRQQTRNREPANEGYDWVRAVWDIGSGG